MHKENGACTQGEILSPLSSYASAATNADQWKWRQICISAVSPPAVVEGITPTVSWVSAWLRITAQHLPNQGTKSKASTGELLVYHCPYQLLLFTVAVFPQIRSPFLDAPGLVTILVQPARRADNFQPGLYVRDWNLVQSIPGTCSENHLIHAIHNRHGAFSELRDAAIWVCGPKMLLHIYVRYFLMSTDNLLKLQACAQRRTVLIGRRQIVDVGEDGFSRPSHWHVVFINGLPAHAWAVVFCNPGSAAVTWFGYDVKQTPAPLQILGESREREHVQQCCVEIKRGYEMVRVHLHILHQLRELLVKPRWKSNGEEWQAFLQLSL